MNNRASKYNQLLQMSEGEIKIPRRENSMDMSMYGSKVEDGYLAGEAIFHKMIEELIPKWDNDSLKRLATIVLKFTILNPDPTRYTEDSHAVSLMRIVEEDAPEWLEFDDETDVRDVFLEIIHSAKSSLNSSGILNHGW